MKKRIISLLLTVLMVLSLFSGLGVSAHAATINGANTIEYTMAQGDYVLRICQKLGLNYYTCKDAIMILNNIYDGQWNKLTVGRTLSLPASDYDALLISNGARTTTYSSGAAATTATTSNVSGTATTGTLNAGTTTTATAASVTAGSADTLAYYLVPYTMAYGDTVSGVCNSLGVNFSIFSPFIKQVNNISSWNKVRAGDTIIVPTPVCPSVGTTCYGVMQHKIASSDTAYGIVNSKGVSYTANEYMLKVLNQTDNLAAIKAGSWFFYPVPLTVSVPGTGNPGSTATTTTTTTVTDGNGTTTTQTTTTAKLYKLTSGMVSSDGTMLFYVDSKPVTAAPAGAKVTIVTDTAPGKAIQSLTVKHADGKADLQLSGDSFIMPSCDVRVDSAIKAGHDINISANYSGKAAASVNNVSVQSAVKGAAVVIRSTDPNYEVSAVYAYYTKQLLSSNKTALTVSSSKAFIMPDADVEVQVTLKPVSTYAFYVNDPAGGSFYLQVNGNAVTRAAKGATVTVVAKAVDGYEPTRLYVWRHGGDKTTAADKVNVFSNTFTMPAFDVDVEVKFGAKGNNILIMPSQLGNVYAFAASDAGISTYDELEQNAITDADTGSTVYLKVIDETGDNPAELDSGYNIDYDIVRNSDGLKVSYNKTYKSFTMPKGGVTITPVITASEKVEVMGEIYMDNSTTAATTYSDCSFSLSYKVGTKDKRAEFKGKNDRAVEIPTLEYVDLRFETSSGVAFVRYEVEVEGTTTGELDADDWSELLTNLANNGGYFQIPDGATKITIKGFFESGKVPMGPATIEGIGSVSYKVSKDDGVTWKSANTCNPGDKVMLIVTPGNGYRFDDDKYQNRLFVNRKDNGAHVTLDRVVDGDGNPVVGLQRNPDDPPIYAYTFDMPAEGVDVKAIFDPMPFIITMKCVDETGKPLTGQGLWQIAIDWVPGVADNMTGYDPASFNGDLWSIFETQFEVAYGDYVTVAMTEAGWSKYDMVSFRIDDQEYTADQLNYFYNFQMIDNRAKNLTITAVLRPKNVSIHSLSAVYDLTKGGVEFLILKSPSGYSDEYRMNNMGRLNYVSKAVAGDTVAIVANSVDGKYSVKAEDITIMPWGTDADRIVPTEHWIDLYGNYSTAGYPNVRVFTFTMPESDISITVNFSGTEHILYVNVQQKVVDPADASVSYQDVSGMVRIFANGLYRDVAFNASFDDIPYKTQVQILRSELAIAENKKIASVDIATATGKPITYTDLSEAGEGIYFSMPDEPVFVVIKIEDIHYDIPTYVINTDVKHGKLVFRKVADPTAPTCALTDFKVGDTVYVFAEPNEGYKNLEPGDLKVYVNGMNNAVSMTPLGTILNIANGKNEPVWQFTLPGGTIIFKADFQKEDAQVITVKVKIKDADGAVIDDAEVKITVDSLEKKFKDDDTLKIFEDKTLTITAPDGYKIDKLVSSSGKGVTSKTSYTVPEAKDLTSNEDELTITLKPSKNSIKISSDTSKGTVTAYNEAKDQIITSANTDDKFFIEVTEKDGYEVDEITVTSTHDNSILTANDDDSYTMPEEGVTVKVTYKAINRMITIKVDPSDVLVNVSVNKGNAIMVSDGTAAPVSAGQTVKITPVAGYRIKMVASGSGKGVTGNTYVVPKDVTEDTLYVSVEDSSFPINKLDMTDGDVWVFGNDSTMSSMHNNANAGDTVYIKTMPNPGYELREIYITNADDGSILEYSKVSDDEYTFTMPDHGVNIAAKFAPKLYQVTIKVVDNEETELTNLVSVLVTNGVETSIDSGKSVDVFFGQQITIKPMGSDQWASKGLTEEYERGKITQATSATGNATYKLTVADEGLTLLVHLK